MYSFQIYLTMELSLCETSYCFKVLMKPLGKVSLQDKFQTPEPGRKVPYSPQSTFPGSLTHGCQIPHSDRTIHCGKGFTKKAKQEFTTLGSCPLDS